MKKIPKFYRDKPMFGVDIGHNNIKVVQVDSKSNGKRIVKAFGSMELPNEIISGGTVVDPPVVAKELITLLQHSVKGSITSRRAVGSLPSRYTYNRNFYFPKLKAEELKDAIYLEIEQSVPIPSADLIVAYDVFDMSNRLDQNGKPVPITEDQHFEVIVTAAPRQLIESYSRIFDEAGLELCAIETSIQSLNRLIGIADDKSSITLLMDIGVYSIDMGVVDSEVRVATVVDGGSHGFTQQIAKQCNVSIKAADIIKFKHGLNPGPYQEPVTAALKPQLDNLVKEVNKIMRFYKERSGSRGGVKQIITTGGGASMPGLSEYLINSMRMPVRMCNVWENMQFGKLKKPGLYSNSSFATATGLALIRPKDIYK